MMADLDKIMKALRNAHAAGDTEAAKRLAAMAKSAAPQRSPAMKSGLAELSAMSQGQQPDQTTGEWLYGNIIGDQSDGVVNAGETLGFGLNDMGRAAASGVARGTAGLVGLPGSIDDALSAGMTKAGKAVGVIPEDWSPPGSMVSGESLVRGLSNVTGGATDYRGETTAGRIAGTVGEFLPGAAAFGGVNPANLAKYGVVPGVASEAAGMATEGSKWEPAARIGAALIAPALAGLAVKGITRAISPYGGADPERLKLAGTLDKAGVPITAGQRVGSEALRRKEGFTAGGKAIDEAQREAFTRAALKTIGTDAPRATPDVLADTAARIGGVFDDVVRGVDVTPDPATVAAMKSAEDTYAALTGGDRAPIVKQISKAMAKSAASGKPIPASTVSVWRSRLSKLTKSSDAATREAAQEAMEAVDDALETSLTALGRADDVARLAEARAQWRSFLTIEKAAVSAGENSGLGYISPASLWSAIKTQGASALARGKRGEIGELARAGKTVMSALPNSGTPAGMQALGLPMAAWGALGASLGSAVTPGVGSAVGAVAGAALPSVAGAARMSPIVQAYLANQVVGQAGNALSPQAVTGLLPFISGASENGLRLRP